MYARPQALIENVSPAFRIEPPAIAGRLGVIALYGYRSRRLPVSKRNDRCIERRDDAFYLGDRSLRCELRDPSGPCGRGDYGKYRQSTFDSIHEIPCKLSFEERYHCPAGKSASLKRACVRFPFPPTKRPTPKRWPECLISGTPMSRTPPQRIMSLINHK